jgi:hypothetical protein
MPDHTDYPLFTVTDGPIDINISGKEFETRLVHGLLLEPGLVMADAYFFSSTHLQRHVLEESRDSISLFEAAMRRGLVVPALRQPAKDFVDVLGYLRGQQMQGNYDSLDDLAFRLSASCDLEASQVIWPARSGLGYDKLIEQCLMGPRPSGVDSQMWKLTDELRHRGITEARRITHLRPSGEGLRRGELARVAGSILGVIDPEDPHAVDYNEMLSRYAQIVGETSSKHRAAKEFFDWIDEIHRVNYARSLGARPSVFASTPSSLAVLQKAMLSVAEDEQIVRPPRDQISVVIKIPSVRRLLRWSPEKLLDARDFGIAWRASARRFLTAPNDLTRHQAEQALEAYAKKLRKISPGPSYIDLSVRAFATKAAPTLLTAASGFILPGIGPYVATAASTGYLAYQYLIRGRYEKVRVSPGLNIIETSNEA